MGCTQSFRHQNKTRSSTRECHDDGLGSESLASVRSRELNFFKMRRASLSPGGPNLNLEFPMYVVSSSQLRQLRKFVPHEEAFESGIVRQVDPTRGEFVVFWSHEWLGRDHPDPDNVQLDCVHGFLDAVASGPSGLRRLLDKSQHTASAISLLDGLGMMENEFVESVCNGAHWIDFLCVPQDTSKDKEAQAQAIMSIAGYAAQSDLMIVLCPPAVHNTKQKACNLASWRARGWCRLELLSLQWTHDTFPVMIITAPDELRIGTDLMAKKMSVADAPLNGAFSCCDFNHVMKGRTVECDKHRVYQCLECLHYVRARGVMKVYGKGLQWRWVKAMRPIVLSGLDESNDENRWMSGVTSLEDFLDEYKLEIEATDEVQNSVLHWAAFLGNSEAVDELLNSYAGLQLLNERNRREMHQDIRLYSLLAGGGATPTILAAERGFVEVVRALTDANAEINAETSYGATALNLASTRGHVGVVKFLLERGAQVDVPLNTESRFFGPCIGFTPLHSAAIEGHEQVVRLLLACGSSATLPSFYGATPLHCSVANAERVGLVRTLISAKANMHARCCDDHPVASWQSAKARDVAMRQGFAEVLQVLMNAEIGWPTLMSL